MRTVTRINFRIIKKFVIVIFVIGLLFNCEKDETLNKAPDAPKTPFPAHNSEITETSNTLSWISSDPEGDALTYDVHFGTDDPPQLVASGQSESKYDINNLMPRSTYYWKIVAHDANGNSTSGDRWRFNVASTGMMTDIDGNT